MAKAKKQNILSKKVPIDSSKKSQKGDISILLE